MYGGSPYEQPPSSPLQPGSTGKIFVGGLSPSVTSEGLISHFSAYGEVIDATIMNDKITGRPRGFGFVTFRNPDAVDALMLEQHVLDGKQVECKRAVPMGYLGGGSSSEANKQQLNQSLSSPPPLSRPSSGPPVASAARYNPEKIFVGGLPISCDDNKLREYFSKYGVIVDAVVMIDRDLQRHRGFGYVLFQDPSAVDGAVADHDKHQIDGKWVDVKRCVVQENTAGGLGGPQSGPMRKGWGKGGGGASSQMSSSGNAMMQQQAPMPGISATMPGYYGAVPSAARPSSTGGGYGGADYGTSQYYSKQPMVGGYGARPAPAGPGGYSVYGAQPTAAAYGYGVADPYATSGYGAPSPYGAMPGAYSTGYAAGNAYAGYMQQQQPPSNPGAANPNDLYAASRRSGYRTSPY